MSISDLMKEKVLPRTDRPATVLTEEKLKEIQSNKWSDSNRRLSI